MSNLNILHFLDTYLPNTENWIFNLISNTKYCVHKIAAYNFSKDPKLSPNIELMTDLADTLYSKKKESNKTGFLRLVEKIEISIFELTQGSYKRKIISKIKEERIDLLHAHFANIGWEMIKIKRKTNLPFLISFYGWDYEMLPHLRPEFKKHYQVLFLEADGFICEGQHGAKILASMGCPKNKIHIVSLGVDTNTIPFYHRIKKPNTLKLIQLASFTEKKGHIYTIKAFSQALNNCPTMELTLIGNERQQGLLQELKLEVKKLALEDKIHFLPPVDYKNIHSTLMEYDIFIHPSCYTKEKDCEGGAPIVLLDAQATGMPVISTNHCDIPGEVIHNKTGLLSAEKDVDGLTNSLTTFYQMDQTKFSKFSLNARKHVERNFDIKHNAGNLDKVYRKIKSQKHKIKNQTTL